ncbi:hypothetical protein [Undibacterium sp. Ji22W]
MRHNIIQLPSTCVRNTTIKPGKDREHASRISDISGQIVLRKLM